MNLVTVQRERLHKALSYLQYNLFRKKDYNMKTTINYEKDALNKANELFAQAYLEKANALLKK